MTTEENTKFSNTPNYQKVHYWLRTRLGNATKCTFCDAENKRFEWALKKGCKYDKKPENFIQLCPSCHRIYDETMDSRANKSKSQKGKRNSIKPIIHIEYGIFYESVNEASELTGLKRTTLIAMLSGQNPNKTKLRYA